MPLEPSLAARLHLLSGMATWDTAAADPEQRVRLAAFQAPSMRHVSPPVRIDEELVPGRHGDFRVRIYRPSIDAPMRPGLVWLHGGAFTGGDLDMPEADTVSREVSYRASATVISVDYHLAVDGVHYPVPLDDAVDAFRWAIANAEAWGIDPVRVSLGGASAGGNLAAGAALRIRDDEDEVQPHVVILAYPAVHRELPESDEELVDKVAFLPAITRILPDFYRRMLENYVGAPVAEAPVYAAPYEADLHGYPRTVVMTSEYDDLVCSGAAFAQKLRESGVLVEYTEIKGMLHGHLNDDPAIAQVIGSFSLIAAAVRS